MSRGTSGTGLDHKVMFYLEFEFIGASCILCEGKGSEAGISDFMNSVSWERRDAREGSFTPNRVYGQDTQPPSTRSCPHATRTLEGHFPPEHDACPRERPAGPRTPSAKPAPRRSVSVQRDHVPGQHNTRGASSKINRPSSGEDETVTKITDASSSRTHEPASTGRGRVTPVSAAAVGQPRPRPEPALCLEQGTTPSNR